MIQLRRLVFRDLVPLSSARARDKADRIAVAGGKDYASYRLPSLAAWRRGKSPDIKLKYDDRWLMIAARTATSSLIFHQRVSSSSKRERKTAARTS